MARTFQQRVAYAARGIVRREDSRDLDNCFEMYDGAVVVAALMRQAEADHELRFAIERMFRTAGTAQWQATAARFAGEPTERLPAIADRMRRQAQAEAAKRMLEYDGQQSLAL